MHFPNSTRIFYARDRSPNSQPMIDLIWAILSKENIECEEDVINGNISERNENVVIIVPTNKYDVIRDLIKTECPEIRWAASEPSPSISEKLKDLDRSNLAELSSNAAIELDNVRLGRHDNKKTENDEIIGGKTVHVTRFVDPLNIKNLIVLFNEIRFSFHYFNLITILSNTFAVINSGVKINLIRELLIETGKMRDLLNDTIKWLRHDPKQVKNIDYQIKFCVNFSKHALSLGV